jgi:hypothetical protein
MLLVIAAATALENRKRGWSVALLGLAALAKETAVLAAIAYVDALPKSAKALVRIAAPLVVAVTPVLLWLGTLRLAGGHVAVPGGVFTLPFSGLFDRTKDLLNGNGGGWLSTWGGLAATASVLVALTVQGLFFALKWRPGDWRWRIGIAHTALMALLANAGGPWEGYPVASARYLLPLLFVFNLSVPRGSWLVLVAGNLSVISGVHILLHPPG